MHLPGSAVPEGLQFINSAMKCDVKSQVIVEVLFSGRLVYIYHQSKVFVKSPRLQMGAGAERTKSMQLTLKYGSAVDHWTGKHSGWFGAIPQHEMALPSLPKHTVICYVFAPAC